jgi:hypothetical protein
MAARSRDSLDPAYGHFPTPMKTRILLHKLLPTLALALAVVLSVGSIAPAATVTVMKVTDTSLSGTFVCTNDPPGVTTLVHVFSGTTVERTLGMQGKVVSPFTIVGIERRVGPDAILIANGGTAGVAPRINRALTSASVTGSIPCEIDVSPTGGGSFGPANISLSIMAIPGQKTREGPFVIDQSSGNTRQKMIFFSVQRPATGTGWITLTEANTGAVLLNCPLKSGDDPQFPTVLQRVLFGTLAITK